MSALAIRPASAAVPQDAADAAPRPPAIQASSAILVDQITGTVIWEKNANVRRPMASTTKIMTGTLLIERARMNDWVSFSQHAVRTPYANLHAAAGERMSMLDLLYCVMLRSANDGCVAAAEHVAGSEAAFVAMMNDKARELGALNTHFVTTNGLHDAQHYSTAADMARITRYASRYPLFNQVVGTSTYKITSRTQNTADSLLENHNRFLGRFAGADGVKTGYVRQSGKCLVASATRLESNYPWRLLAVVLNSPDTYGESAALLEYGFKNFQPVFFARQGQSLGSTRVAGALLPSISLRAATDVFAVIPRGAPVNVSHEVKLASDVRAPIRPDQPLGSVAGYLNGELVTTADLVTGRSIPVAWTAGVSRWGTWSLLVMILLVFGPRYARSLTEGTRRRRRRVPARSRRADREWAGEREWAARTGTGN